MKQFVFDFGEDKYYEAARLGFILKTYTDLSLSIDTDGKLFIQVEERGEWCGVKQETEVSG